jgi:hypothetical protein
VLLIATLWGSSAAVAGNDATGVEVCSSGKTVAIRAAGHPGKSTLMPRRDKQVPARCSASTAHSLMLVSFVDAAGGEALTRGNLARAIRQLNEQDPGSSDVLALNNQCVAHTALRQWAEARSSCDAAVTAAAEQREVLNRWPGERRRLANKVAAAVYSNRAVMNWLADDAAAAQGDFARAQAMAPKANFVVRNAELAARLPARVEYANLPVG